MNNLKLFLRLLFKITMTPFVVLFIVLLLIVEHIIMFFQWLYDSEGLKDSKMDRDDYINFLKKWFTTP